MAKKRKADSKNDLGKSLPTEVISEDLGNHPLCFHGPTLLFSSERGRYYSCSLCRDRKDCTLTITEKEWEKESVRKRNEKYLGLISGINKKLLWKHRNEIRSLNPSMRAYCVTCNELYNSSLSNKHKDHRKITPLSDSQLEQPSIFLPALDNDTVEAQYLFTKKSIGVIVDVLKNNNIKNILCIGTPSIHDAAPKHGLKSLLLDYDRRHAQFNPPDKYIYYNMFNNFFFNGRDDENIVKKYFKDSINEGLCIIMDPPFGGRVEPLAQTIQELTNMYKSIDKKYECNLLPVVWVFPYFSEPYIKNLVPEIKMHDYQVEYNNHTKFQSNNKRGRKFGSPVRLFTNLPFNTINLSTDSNYKFCQKCNFWVSKLNNHCNKCGVCSSKNGMTYNHCDRCSRCVKPTFFHCNTCKRCCQKKDHVCGVVVMSQSCYNCKEKGHKSVDCPRKTAIKKAKK